jgi:peroxiredoxin
MHKPLFALLSIAVLPLALTGCKKGSSADTTSPDAFLKWSMNQYQKAKTFSAKSSFQMDGAVFGIHSRASRSLTFQAPNKYRMQVTGEGVGSSTVTSDSDGSKEVDYSTDSHMEAASVDAPKTIAEVATMPMNHPMLGGTLLYQFFGGAANIGNVEQISAGPATWGPDGTAPGGEKTKTVKFVGTKQFGNVEVTIGVDTGLVYQLKFDAAPVQQTMLKGNKPEQVISQMQTALPKIKPGKQHDMMESILKTGPSAFTITAIETYQDPKFEPVLTADTFAAKIPSGIKVAPPAPDGKAPVPLGTPAPDFTVRDLNGKSIKLSSLRGQVVLVDFWATWCGPCKAGLPVTSKIAEVGAKKGLKVLAVSEEPVATVDAFVKKQTYKLPAYCDIEDNANLAYHVREIPCTIVVDAKGNLVDYFKGLRQPEEIVDSLKRAGVDVSQ